MEIQKIRVNHMLDEINQWMEGDTSKVFSISYISSNGHRKTIYKALKGGKFSGGNLKHNISLEALKRRGTLKLFNKDENRPETPKIFSITKYNGMPVLHG